MDNLTCGVCLLNLDKDDEVSPALEDRRTSCDMLWFKLQFIGFFQSQARSELPEYICQDCAIRVDDAYGLKLQCLKTQLVCCDRSSSQPPKDLNSNDIYTELPNSESTSSVSDNLPDLLETTSIAQDDTSAVQIILSSAYDMFACVQNLSSALKLNTALLSGAIHFMENTLSLLTVMFSLKENFQTMKKSAQSIRSETKSWNLRSSMVHDAASFAQVLSGGAAYKIKRSLKPDTTGLAKQTSTLTTTSCNSNCSVVPSSPSDVLSESNLSSKSSSMLNSDSEEVSRKNDSESLEPRRSSDFSNDEVHLVRRSIRSRACVDHLVYWPSFRKQGTSNSKSASKLRSTKRCMEPPRTSSEALDRLFLKRDIDSDPQKPLKDDKWSIVPKKKGCNDTHTDIADKVDPKLLVDEKSGNSKVLSSSDNSSKECGICHKVLSSNRNLQAHMKMHTGSSPFPCSYCSKSFSSGWNRAQHERVHTGVKPYICEICQESFRYNVTLRHHKIKRHNVS